MSEALNLQLWLHRWQTLMVMLTQAGILLVFATGTLYWRPRWMKGPLAPDFISNGLNQPLNTDAYREVSFARYAIALFVIFVLFFWTFSGFYGLRNVFKNGRWQWLGSFAVLVGWVWASVNWSAANEAVATSQAWQWVLTFGFVTVVLSVSPSARWLSVALVSGVILQAIVGIAQVILQRDIGIGWIDDHILGIGLGLLEFPLDPAESGISVIMTENIRFLRAYGITPHPNLLGPGLIMAVIGALWMWRSLDRRVVVTVIAILVWALFLTFSRASIGGLAVGTATSVLIWTVAGRPHIEALMAFAVSVVVLAGVFYLLYQPLIDVRAGTGNEGETSLETLSVTERAIYEDQAQEIIRNNPVRGIGIGNFPWVSHRMLRDTPQYEIQGNNVHNVYYLAIAEIGFVGAGLIVLNALIAGIWVYRMRGELSLAALSLVGGLVAWLAVGWFEFFFWVLLPYQLLFWGIIAGIMKEIDYAENRSE